jgi:hypothetical protein
MSFSQTIGDFIVNFGAEEDYLNCRLEYLQMEAQDIFAPTFLKFIQDGDYDSHKCNVQSIIQVWHPSSTIIHAEGSASFTFGTSTGGEITVSAPSSSSVGISPEISGSHYYDQTTTNAPIAYAGVSTEIAGSYHYDQTTNTVNIAGYDYSPNFAIATPDFQEGLSFPQSSQEPPSEEEPPDDPIENRWDILDLRRE